MFHSRYPATISRLSQGPEVRDWQALGARIADPIIGTNLAPTVQRGFRKSSPQYYTGRMAPKANEDHTLEECFTGPDLITVISGPESPKKWKKTKNLA